MLTSFALMLQCPISGNVYFGTVKYTRLLTPHHVVSVVSREHLAVSQ